MFGLNLLRNAVARLSASLNGLADTCDAINSGVRQQIGFNGAAPLDVPVLPLTMPAEASRIVQETTEAADGPEVAPTPPASSRNGRRRATANAEA
ncbi:MAG TPA: hypothetical protein VKA46_33860 [Gemmataceae bacterium]|nr:hypothetical protein [Gemmataceae bacterium]